jgi:hypothetical protein
MSYDRFWREVALSLTTGLPRESDTGYGLGRRQDLTLLGHSLREGNDIFLPNSSCETLFKGLDRVAMRIERFRFPAAGKWGGSK